MFPHTQRTSEDLLILTRVFKTTGTIFNLTACRIHVELYWLLKEEIWLSIVTFLLCMVEW